MHKRLLILFILLGLSTAYSVISLLGEDDIVETKWVNESPGSPKSQKPDSERLQYLKKETPIAKPKLDTSASDLSKDKQLPFAVKLLGISDDSASESGDESFYLTQKLVLIEIDNELFEHVLNDSIGGSDVRLVKIHKASIDLQYNNDLYSINLTTPNLLAEKYSKEEDSYAELLKMTPDQIGTRPRIIEHLLTLTPTPYIADGQLAGPGINPDLFKQAGFQPDDVLKTINGKSVTIESEFEEVKQELKTAQTLTFVVMRRGRLITLFLDIPSEALEISLN